MKRTSLIAIAGGSALVLTGPLAAQNATQPSAPAQASAPAQPTTPQTPANPVAASNAENAASQNAQSTDLAADPKVKAKPPKSTCTPITAGPNQGQFIGKCRR